MKKDKKNNTKKINLVSPQKDRTPWITKLQLSEKKIKSFLKKRIN